jgi:glycosyltransferase involved in cell wall biosynthesis
MILIFGPYPYPQQVRGGWLRRIAAIDRLFADRERAYVYPVDPLAAHDWRDYRPAIEQVAPGVTYHRLDLRFSHHHRHLAELVNEAEFVYAHTSHSSQYLLPYYATGKIITDLHGIAPEEELLQGRPCRSAFFAAFEEAMVRQSAALVTVTRAMTEHLRRKYPGSDRPVIELPIVEDFGDGVVAKRPARSRPVVVYVGGLQQWQNVDLMLRSVASCRERCEFRFYTDDTDGLRRLAGAHGVADAVRIATADPSELPAIYADADYGFVLRDDVTVNRVSCPTKLSEYLALGVVPIVTLVEIGDFATLGYRHVVLDELLHGRLPDHATATAMRMHNRTVFAALQQAFETGRQRLRQMPPPASTQPVQPACLLTSLERTTFYPVRRAGVVIERVDGKQTIELDDLVQARVDLDIELPGAGRITALRVFPGAAPFVTSPIVAELLNNDGGRWPLELRGCHAVDRYGNWCFIQRDAAVTAMVPEGFAAARLRLRWEYLLLGTEALVSGSDGPRPRGWLDRLKACVGRVPGIHAAWTRLQRLRRG